MNWFDEGYWEVTAHAVEESEIEKINDKLKL